MVFPAFADSPLAFGDAYDAAHNRNSVVFDTQVEEVIPSCDVVGLPLGQPTLMGLAVLLYERKRPASAVGLAR